MSFHGTSKCTLGSANLEFPIVKSESLLIKFQVVNYSEHKIALDFDGILGNTFMREGEVILNYKTKTLDIKAINCTTQLYNFSELKPIRIN